MILGKAAPYCASRYSSIRRFSRVVNIGSIATGGENPVRIQSMTTTNTLDVKSTVEQTIELAEAGCEIVRITAPNVRAAEALGEISKKVRSAGIEVPLVADIHFMPSAAMEAVKDVEKVRINPGNYADRKKFQIREYSESQYEEELDRLYESFSPLVLRCMELGRSLRIGTNHGSLSDRIMNRFGDTPRGMAESALEFLRIARFHGYHQIILSMKSSNPKVMIQAYRLVVSMMNEEDMHYPLHLGVTEAGDGEDARIKSSIGIGSLLLDGLGDTIPFESRLPKIQFMKFPSLETLSAGLMLGGGTNQKKVSRSMRKSILFPTPADHPKKFPSVYLSFPLETGIPPRL